MASPLPTRPAHQPWGVPASLGDLRGPNAGTVALPLHLCWSGARRYDVSQFSARLLMYQIVITEGELMDIERFLDAGLLMTVWPRLRRHLHPRYVRPWEERFPELVEVVRAAEPAVQEELRRARRAARDGRPI